MANLKETLSTDFHHRSHAILKFRRDELKTTEDREKLCVR